ncbi:DNA photolyase family protein [Mumia sp. zg.B17]|uniref:cryptochrome/photolyase family protein n=2 Tax=unclassified Mumia TaxID=2621872 RepID=UPI001C6F333D|nr:deoxyribodipyrimidine photo-lyase [Mumia sp. zg.B17]MBW9206978.1 DNA photolyase family protein [Mumia sp. zg.B17]
MPISVLWFRRDLRLGDNPALVTALEAGGDGVVPLFVLDPRLWDAAPPPRRAYLAGSLRDLSRRLGATGLHVVAGDPAREVVGVARRVGAASVHVAGDHTPYGRRRDTRVADALGEHGVALVRTGSPYAVAPGRVTRRDGGRYQVFTPYYAAWLEHGWRAPARDPYDGAWVSPGPPTVEVPDAELPDGLALPVPGEVAARRRWDEFVADGLDDYATERDLPGDDRTSRMSVHLRWGEIHPRTLLAGLGRGPGSEAYRRELAFREFYADVLDQRPDSAWDPWVPAFASMAYDTPAGDLEAWKEGRTGIPVVDAGMRQLLAQGWMHNRVRMIVASFLVKDLHLAWQHGARHFAEHLVDFDLASNQHNWQWVAGCGTDAAPYFRVFNPVTQAKKFDRDGTYVRRWVPELADVPTRWVHEPWLLPDPPASYPPPLVDHAEERREALRRYEEIR